MKKLDILVVDDEPDIRDLISGILRDRGFSVRTAADSAQTFQLMSEQSPSAIILDVWLQGSEMDGLGILEIVKKKYPLMPVVVISGHGTTETAVSAIKMGAFDYLEKPFSQEKLMIVLKRAYESAKLKKENSQLRAQVTDKTEFIGHSPAFDKLRAEIQKVAPTAGRVMLKGLQGSGKELAARLIHKLSKRLSAPFLTFCPTCLNDAQVDAELFGDQEPTGKDRITRTRGIIEMANTGTLYIDEVGDLPVNAQLRLLRFLQYGVIEKKSTGEKIKLDVRIITSSSRSLETDISQGKFRQDLFYRLSIVPIRVPSLSEKKEDIPLLVKYFVEQLSKSADLKPREFSSEAIAALQSYDWPGNVRQLRNVIEWTLIMNPPSRSNDIILSEMLPSDVINKGVEFAGSGRGPDLMAMPLREAREIFEKQYLTAQMNRFNNNISKTSSFVGMERSALHRKLKLLNIHSGNSTKYTEKKIDELV